jgi:hypothetical protein
LREEHEVGPEFHRVLRGLEITPFHIDGVAQALERVEADADGKHDTERSCIEGHAEQGERVDERQNEEIVVFEETQHAQVPDQADAHPEPTPWYGPTSSE